MDAVKGVAGAGLSAGTGGTPGPGRSRENGFGLLRLLLALAVVASHARPLGFGGGNPGTGVTRGQTDLGTLAVCGFFVLSGLLVTRSAVRLPVGRFLLHRALRLLPGLWCCLLVTALVVAPAVAWHEGAGVADLFGRPDGPWGYLAANWLVTVHQYGIGGLLGAVPHPYAFDGSLWSLRYEVLAYLVVAVLAAAGLLRRAGRLLVPLLAVGCWAVLAAAAPGYPGLRAPTYAPDGIGFDLPVFGTGSTAQLVPLFLAFALGASAAFHPGAVRRGGAGAAAVATVVLAVSLRCGGFTVVGLPALAYLLLWAAEHTPAPLRAVGRRHDYSYGLYVYAFPAQQVLAELGANHWGYAPYLVSSVLCAGAAAVLSWHLVEAPALRLRGVFRRRTNLFGRSATGERPREIASPKVDAVSGGGSTAGIGENPAACRRTSKRH
ncbi:acyltransferase family protein [Kitasatospora sp. KL5]|uniref:acyltransferase family protein n=1 Tax=Kitasatospora sp. KL5 TaxID=3425125 RepID=UPI003D6F3FC6